MEESCAARLARFFPGATPARIPVRVTRLDAEGSPGSAATGNPVAEDTVIEFGTPQEVLFGCRLPLSFTGRIRLQNADGSLDTEADIVALQFHQGRTAAAARFAGNVKNWIIKR